jgi:hypothetical protein
MVTACYLFTVGAPPDGLEIAPFSLVLYSAVSLVGATVCSIYAILNFSAALGNKRQKKLSMAIDHGRIAQQLAFNAPETDGHFKYAIAAPSCITSLFENEKPEWGRVLHSGLSAVALLLLGWVMLSISIHEGVSAGHTGSGSSNNDNIQLR